MSVNYLYELAPPPQTVEWLDCGIGWVCMPLPFALDHVNVWILGNDSESSLLIDTSISSNKTRAIWQSLLDSQFRPPKSLLLTHYHPDHLGLAAWFQEQLEVDVMMSQQEYEQASVAFTTSDSEFSKAQNAWYQRHGIDEKRLATVAASGNSYRSIVSGMPTVGTILSNADEVVVGDLRWRVITGGGHSPEQICLYSEQLNVLIAADQILPRITPNISLNWYKNRNDPLADYMQSFADFRALPADVLVLPSHGRPFIGLHERIDFIEGHHHERLHSLQEALHKPASANELLPILFNRELDPRQMMFAMGECLAHLRYLENKGEIVAELNDDKVLFVGKS